MFTPFQKPISDLTPDDLLVLTGVSEGWYVEYKGNVPDNKAIAKSVSAFANHFGGWLFFGISGTRDGFNTAADFLGLPDSEYPQLQARIRDAISANINPTPVFELRSVQIPGEPSGTSDHRSIIVVQVPQGSNPPYVHSSGRIYRRIADKSDPVPETDRATLDILWRRGQQAHKCLRRFLNKEPELSKGESETPLFTLMMLPDPLGDRRYRSKIEFEKFCAIMRSGLDGMFDFPCDNVFSSADGFIARQVGTNNPSQHCLTWKHYFSGASVISLTLRVLDPALNPQVSHYVHWAEFMRLTGSNGYHDTSFIDLNLLMSVLQASVSKQFRLMDEGKVPGVVYLKAKASGLWRRVPFVDSPSYITFCEKNGVPLIQESKFVIPDGFGPDDFVRTDKAIDQEPKDLIIGAAVLWIEVLKAFGLSGILDEDGMLELMGTVSRGMESHKVSVDN